MCELVLAHLKEILAHIQMSRLFIIVCIDNFQCTRTLLLRSHKITKSDECTLPIAVAFPENESANRHSSTFEAGIFQLNQRTDVFLSDNPLTHLLIGRYEHPHVRSHEAKLSMFGNQIKQPVNECSEEICFAILIMVLHELFELDAHILCTHIWRVRHHCRVFTCEVPCLGENLLHTFTQKRVKQRGFGFSIFCRCGKINKLLRRLNQRTVHIRLRIGIPYREVQIHLV